MDTYFGKMSNNNDLQKFVLLKSFWLFQFYWSGSLPYRTWVG